MQKTTLAFYAIAALWLTLLSCQKESSTVPTETDISKKVNTWLDNQKSRMKPEKKENVNLLKQNLKFSEVQHEEFIPGHKYIIIPINDQFKVEKNIQIQSIPILLIVMNNKGNITQGNLVIFTPEVGESITKLPANTFYNLHNQKEIESDGRFQFQTIAGKLLYHLNYKNGNLESKGYIQVKPKDNSSTRTNMCWDSYMHETWYVDGILVYENWEYLGTYCDGESCYDPNLASLCPDEGGGGGGEVVDCNASLEEFAAGSSASENLTSEIFYDAPELRGKMYKWKMWKDAVGWVWFNSYDSAYLKKVGGSWQYQSIKHVKETKEGVVIGGSISMNSVTSTPAHALYNAAMGLSFSIESSIVCRGFPLSTNKDYTASMYFNVND